MPQPQDKSLKFVATVGLNKTKEESTFLGAWQFIHDQILEEFKKNNGLVLGFLSTCWVEEFRDDRFFQVYGFEDAKEKAYQLGWKNPARQPT